MKRNSLSRAFVPLASISLVMLSAAVAASQPPNPAQEEQQKKRELARMTLPEAARLAGEHYVRDWNVGTWAIAPDLKSLTDSSDVVVIGDVVNERPVLSKDQMYITTIATVRVVEAVKGKANGSVKLVVLGGRIVFPDGTSAETKPNGGEPLKIGSRYVLFLDSIDKGTPRDSQAQEAIGGYIPKLGPQGIFELRAGGVEAHGRDIDIVKEQHQKEPVASFLEKVRKTAAGSKRPAQ